MSRIETPPEKLVLQADKINREWLVSSKHSLQLYKEPGDFGDAWKFKIIRDSDQMVVMEHIHPSRIDGHTAYLAIDAIACAERRGFKLGLKHAAEELNKKIHELFGIRPG